MNALNLTEVSDQELVKKDIKLAFFDIDGTLLGLEGRYTEEVKKEISRIQSMGVKTAIASGRPNFAAKFIADELSLQDPGLFCTGAHIYDPRENASLELFGIDKILCRDLIDYLRQSNIYYELYTEDQYLYENDRHEKIRFTHAEHMRIFPAKLSFDEVLENSAVVKFLVAVDNLDDQKALHEMEQAFPQCHFAYASIAKYPDWSFASIIDKSACKHNAFDRLLDHYDLEADNVICFGDAQSDMVFLERAGTGISMGNAKPEVQAISNYVTKPVWEDGVAYALSRLVN